MPMVDAHSGDEGGVTGSRKLLLVLLLAALVAILFFYDQGAAENYAGKAYSKVSSASHKVARWTQRMFESGAPNCEPGISKAPLESSVESVPAATVAAGDRPADAVTPSGENVPGVQVPDNAASPASGATANALTTPYPPGSWSSIPEQGKAPPPLPDPLPPIAAAGPTSSAPPLAPVPPRVPDTPTSGAPAQPLPQVPAIVDSRPPITEWSYPVRPAKPAPLLPVPEAPRPAVIEPRDTVEDGLAPARTAAAERRIDDAIREYRKYLAIHPNDTNAFGELGNVYLSAGRNTEAAQNYYEAATRLIDAGRIDAVAPLMPIIRRHEPMLYALLERKAARAVQREGVGARR